jgi:hypothetical protein
VPGLQSFSTTYDTTNVDNTQLKVTISAGLDQQTGVVTWTFLSLDPATGLTPTNPIAGFLPVDDSTGRGQAFVHYTIRAKSSDTTGTAIGAQATVVFDANAPLNTNTAANTVDAGAPTSSVTALPANETPTFTVSWAGQDDTGGSGIATYDVFVSDNGGPFTVFQTATTLTSATFNGATGHTYGFYSVATDNVGNRQTTPTGPQTSTTVVNTATTIGGTTPSTSITDQQTATPFSGVTLTDPDAGETYSIRVALNAAANGSLSTLSGGSYSSATGVYTLGNVSLAAAQAAVRALVFTPTAHQVAAGSTVKTTFTITVIEQHHRDHHGHGRPTARHHHHRARQLLDRRCFGLQPDHRDHRRQPADHVQRECRHLARRPDAEHQHRRPQRHADDGRQRHVHRDRHR